MEQKYGLVKGHAYAFLDATTVKVNGIEQRLVRLRNPWGNFTYMKNSQLYRFTESINEMICHSIGNAMEWNGDWSDRYKL